MEEDHEVVDFVEPPAPVCGFHTIEAPALGFAAGLPTPWKAETQMAKPVGLLPKFNECETPEDGGRTCGFLGFQPYKSKLSLTGR